MSPSRIEMSDQNSAGGFNTTRWTLIRAAGAPTEDESKAHALERLCSAYWMPLFHYIRRKGHAQEEARELTQEFFARLLQKNWLGDADPGRGRFRSFLLGAANHFLNNEWSRSQRLKRGGGASFVSFDAVPDHEWLEADARQGETPELQFDRKWLHAILATVLGRLKEELGAAGRDRHFEVLKVFLTEDRGTHPYAEAAAELGMSESGVKAAIWRMRQRYGEIFREEVALTVQDPSEVDDEIRHLLGIMG